MEYLERRRLLSAGRMGGYIHEDADGDGYNANTGISGVTVFIDADNNGTLDAGEKSTVTDSGGWFEFDHLPLDRYVVRQIVPSGFTYAWRYVVGSGNSVLPTSDSIRVNALPAHP